MSYLRFHRPWEAERSVAAMEAWLEEVRGMREQYAGDAGALVCIEREIAESERGLEALRARDAAGIVPIEDDGLIDLDDE